MMVLWLVFIFMTIALIFFNLIKSKNKELPGPPAIPLLGNIIQMMNAFQTHTYPFTYFAQKYGEIYRLKIPFDEIVILTSYEAIHGVLSHEGSMGRDLSGILIDRNYGQNLGVILANGQVWEEGRRWVVRNLKEYGFGKSKVLEASVNAEIAEFLKDFDKDGTQILQVNHTFLNPVSHIMYKMMAGPDIQIDKKTLNEMNAQTALMEKASGLTGTLGAALAIYFPVIRFIFPDWTGRSIQLSCRSTMQKESRRLMAAAKVKMSTPGVGVEADSLTEKFVAQMNANNGNSSTGIFTELNHDVVFADLFQASSNTTASYLEAIFLYMILYPDVQEKVYREIQDTIPAGHEIIYEDRNRMTFSSSVMLEIHRLAKISQHLLPRRAVADFEYKNFRIKKNSMILADMNSIFSNPKIFEDPLSFQPKRFIDPSGKIINQKQIIPFGIGKRSCPGELFADVTAFLFFLNIIKKFKLSCIPGEPKPKAEMLIGVTSCPHPFSLLMAKRQ